MSDQDIKRQINREPNPVFRALLLEMLRMAQEQRDGHLGRLSEFRVARINKRVRSWFHL